MRSGTRSSRASRTENSTWLDEWVSLSEGKLRLALFIYRANNNLMNSRVLYIIPGWEDKRGDPQYMQLAEAARGKGYEVVFKDIDWTKPLSQQVFAVPEDATVFGFSLGATLAWLVAQKYPCEHLILASMTLHKSFTDEHDKEALQELTGEHFVDDIISHLTSSNLAKKQTIMYGALEEEDGDVLVPDTEHELTGQYIREITKIL